ncbi:MAG: hypothetical protein F6K26_54230 [Moorea sp. SIO2I5]|nr:hypothetical protein [Moorena sp. SIO2I5]
MRYKFMGFMEQGAGTSEQGLRSRDFGAGTSEQVIMKKLFVAHSYDKLYISLLGKMRG